MASPATIEAYKKKLDGRSGNGGARINAGPIPTKKLFTQRFNQLLEQSIAKRMGKMIDAQIDAAIGITSEKYDRKKDELYYVENGPSTEAFKTLTNRALGMPQTKVEHSGGIGVLHLIKALNAADGNSGQTED